MSALAPSAKYPTAKFPTPGTRVKGVITQPPVDRQAKEYGTDKLAYWPSGDPIMETKIILRQGDGTEVALYAKGRLAQAITGAIIKANVPDLEVGGELDVLFTEYGTGKNPANPPKLYEATYEPPAEDPFS